MTYIKIFSWNILGPETKDVPWFIDRYPEIINWHKRFELIIQKILHIKPDVICLQEIGQNQKQIFESVLFNYGFFLASYAPKGPHGGVILFYKKERFTLNNLGHIHINPYQKFHHDSACAWATLLDHITNKSILITSAHFQPQYIQEQLNEYFEALSPLSDTIPIVIIGDFNTRYKKMIDELMPYLHKLDVSAYAINMFYHESWTHQSTVKHDNIGGWSSLDHVIYTDNLKIDITRSFVGDPSHSYKTDLVSIQDHNVHDALMKPIPNKDNPSDHLPLIINVFFSLN